MFPRAVGAMYGREGYEILISGSLILCPSSFGACVWLSAVRNVDFKSPDFVPQLVWSLCMVCENVNLGQPELVMLLFHLVLVCMIVTKLEILISKRVISYLYPFGVCVWLSGV